MCTSIKLRGVEVFFGQALYYYKAILLTPLPCFRWSGGTAGLQSTTVFGLDLFLMFRSYILGSYLLCTSIFGQFTLPGIPVTDVAGDIGTFA